MIIFSEKTNLYIVYAAAALVLLGLIFGGWYGLLSLVGLGVLVWVARHMIKGYYLNYELRFSDRRP